MLQVEVSHVLAQFAQWAVPPGRAVVRQPPCSLGTGPLLGQVFAIFHVTVAGAWRHGISYQDQLSIKVIDKGSIPQQKILIRPFRLFAITSLAHITAPFEKPLNFQHSVLND